MQNGTVPKCNKLKELEEKDSKSQIVQEAASDSKDSKRETSQEPTATPVDTTCPFGNQEPSPELVNN